MGRVFAPLPHVKKTTHTHTHTDTHTSENFTFLCPKNLDVRMVLLYHPEGTSQISD